MSKQGQEITEVWGWDNFPSHMMNSTQAGSIHYQPSLWATIPPWLAELQLGAGFQSTYVCTLTYTQMHMDVLAGTSGGKLSPDMELTKRFMYKHPPSPRGSSKLRTVVYTAPKATLGGEIQGCGGAVMAGARVFLLPGIIGDKVLAERRFLRGNIVKIISFCFLNSKIKKDLAMGTYF